jgi:hypothetical protein
MRRLAWLTLLALSSGCIGQSLGEPKVVVTPEAESWSLGESREIEVVFRNTAGRPFRFTSSTCTEPIAWVKLTTGNAALRPKGEPPECAQVVLETEVPAGEERSAVYVWNGSSNPSDETGDLVPPGSYTILGGFFGDTSWNATGVAVIRLY